MRTKSKVIPVLALITAAMVGVVSLGLTGCDTGSGTNTGGTTDTTVNTPDLTALVTAPVKGAAPQSTFAEQAQYTGTIAWKTNADADHTGVFAAATVYKAVITLTAKTGFTFTGVAANSFTYTGATVTNAANSGTVTITFPATTAEGQDTVVNALSLDSLVTAPVKGATQNTTAINTAQYTGTIVWFENNGTTAAPAAFAANTVYKAIVTLMAKPSFTFTGVAANSFTYTGATVTNAANSGTVTITFPATTAEGQDTVVNALSLDSLVTAPVKGATQNTTAINTAQYTGTIVWFENNGTTAAPAAFAANTVYKAIVTLTAKNGFTFTGVAANRFTYTGATVTNAANSGTVTITFPATGTDGSVPTTGTSTVTVNLWTNDAAILATADSVTLSRAASQTALITGPSGAEYTNHQWSINGIDVAAPAGTAPAYTFSSLGRGNGTYYVGLQVKSDLGSADNAWYLTTITITVTN
ncbi:hypothetical protein AGMMS4952_07500 [Spirochaetia bacterium]|nr:hypothetical protein AGMMS4952_07500 [Spirochaetia bacterium]